MTAPGVSPSPPVFKARGCWCDQLRAAGASGDIKCGFCLAAEVVRLREELEEAKFDVRYGEQESIRACEAIRASESLPKGHYPSFQERVWWLTAQRQIAEAEAALDGLRALFAAASDGSKQASPDHVAHAFQVKLQRIADLESAIPRGGLRQA